MATSFASDSSGDDFEGFQEEEVTASLKKFNAIRKTGLQLALLSGQESSEDDEDEE